MDIPSGFRPYLTCAMKLLTAAGLTLIMLPGLVFAQDTGDQRPQIAHWQTLVEADQRFAQLSAQAGRRAAFLEFLAPDSVVFREGPVDALTLYSSSSFAEAASEIDWKAHYVDVSNAGDVGLSAGPLTIFNESGSDSYGHLISMWRSSGAGWELMADIVVGIPGFLSLDVEPSYADTLPVIAETSYMRLWRFNQEGEWRIAVEVLSPF